MKVFVQMDKAGMPYSINGYVAMLGFKEMGFEIVPFRDYAAVADQLAREDLVVGGIGTVRRRLEALGVAIEEIDYPAELEPYLGRKVWTSTMNTINSHPEMWPVFVKSVAGKKITGKVIRSPRDLMGLGSSYEDPEVRCSEVVDFVAEWRCYVRYGQVEGVRPYFGDWHYHYDPAVIEHCLADYRSQPAGFSLDIGVTKQGQTLLVEVNEGYSLAAYGLTSIRYAKLLSARWAELTGTPDECAFDQE